VDDKRFDLIVELEPGGTDLRPEMTARVDVSLGERPDVLLIPVNAVFERDGVTVAHVVRSLGADTRAVQLGESDDAVVEVVAGLEEGERVALSDVAASGGGPVQPATAAGGKAAGGKLTPLPRAASGALQPR
jgi:multidrug efflux pump subunit AcrA (membrane-fusion protein)